MSNDVYAIKFPPRFTLTWTDYFLVLNIPWSEVLVVYYPFTYIKDIWLFLEFGNYEQSFINIHKTQPQTTPMIMTGPL